MIGITILEILAGGSLGILFVSTNYWLCTLLERDLGFDFGLSLIGVYFTDFLLLGIVLTLLHI